MEFDFFGHEKSWNLNFQKEYEPCTEKHCAPLYRPLLTDKKLSTELGYTVSVIQCTCPGVVGGHV